MKRSTKITSLILVLSLLLSCTALTVSAVSPSARTAGVDIDDDVELFTPNANYVELTDETGKQAFVDLKSSEDTETSFGVHHITSAAADDDIKTYLVESEETDDYIMFVPTQATIKRGEMDYYLTNGNKNTKNHLYINANVNTMVTHSASAPTYYVWECDVATEQFVLPFYYQIVSRTATGGGNWSAAWTPGSDPNSLYMTMEPGYFHHLTFIGDIYNNVMYVYIDNQLVTAHYNGVMSADGNRQYKQGVQMKIEGVRMQLASGYKIEEGMSLSVKNMYGTILTGSSEYGNLDAVLGGQDLSSWTENRCDSSHKNDPLVSLVEINGIKYTSATAASKALDTYKIGNEAYMLRSLLSGYITVNSDAVFHTYTTGADIRAGADVTLTKADGSTWIATLKNPKYSNTTIASNPYNIEQYVNYDHPDNIITSISQGVSITKDGAEVTDAAIVAGVKSTTINGDIIRTDDGNTYISVYDNSGAANDFGTYNGTIYEAHYQVNANTNIVLNNKNITNLDEIGVAGHDLVVFDYDVYCESSFINVYNGFILRNANGNTPIQGTSLFMKDAGSDIGNRSAIELTPGTWNHVTFIGDINTGTMYVYVDNVLNITVEQSLYTEDAKESIGLNNMCLGSFRANQVSDYSASGHRNPSGQYLTPDTACATDNYVLRFVDGSNYTAGQSNLNNWDHSICTSSYKLPEIPLLATVNGVPYYASSTLDSLLNVADDDFSKPEQDVVFYRSFRGSVTINCRASVNTNGITYGIHYGAAVTTSANGNIVNVYKQSPADEDAYTKEWTEDIIESFANQKTTSATNANVYSAIKSGTANNKYSSHTLGTGGPSWVAQQLNVAQTETSGTATYDDNTYLFDNKAQTHTLVIGTSVASNVTTSNPVATASVKRVSLQLQATTTFNCNVTENQYYFTLEFDIGYSGTFDASKKEILTFTFNNTSFDVDLTSVLEGKASGEFAHVTVVGTIDTTTSITTSATYSVSRSGSVFNYSYTDNTSNPQATASNTYAISYNTYVNGVKVASGNKDLGSSAVSTWTNAVITGSGNSIAIDNVYANTECVTKTWKYSTSKTSSNSNYSTAVSNAGTSIQNDKLSSSELASMSTNSDNSGSVTLDNIVAGSTTPSFNASSLPSSVVTGTSDLKLGEETKTEDVPAVNYPIAYVYTTDGEGNTVATPYYEADAAALAEVLATANTEAVTVSFLRTPEVPFTLGTNAKIDTNGLDVSDLIKYDENNNDYHVVTDGDSVEVVVIEKTVVIANLNGEDFKSLNLLQEALNLADEAELVFYVSMKADESITITCPANITTNGCTVNYHADKYAFDITETTEGGEVTEISIVKNNKTGMIKINLSAGGNTYNVHTSPALSFGTNIVDYLTNSGMFSGAFVVDGTVWYDATWDVTPSGYVDTTDTITYTATATKSSNADFVYVDESGALHEMSKEEVAAADTDVIMSWFTQNGNSTLVLNEDWNIKSTSGVSTATSGVKNVYLNGKSINAPGNTANHTWVLGGTASYNIYGAGTMNFTKNTATHAIFFAGYDYTGTVTLSGVTLNTSQVIASLRGGNIIIKGSNVNAFTNNTLPGLITLGEDYTNDSTGVRGYSDKPLSLTLLDSNITFRYSDIRNTYTDRKNADKCLPLVYHKVIDGDGATDPTVSVVIDGCHVVAQGSIFQANAYNPATGAEDAYQRSNATLYINDSTIIAKRFANGDLKLGSIVFYDNIKTNITSTSNVSFNSELIKANTGDGLAEILYTSHNYATITWSDGATEFWAAGSLPVRATCPFDNTTFVNAGETKKLTKGSSVSFSFLANLTLANTIGFNIYIPTTEQITAVYMDGKLIPVGEKITYVINAGTECYNYTLNLPAHEAGKTFSILILLKDGRQVTRTTSVAHYAQSLKKANSDVNSNWLETDDAVRAKALLSASLGYIEHATMYAGYNVNNMLKLSTVLAACGTFTRTPSGTVADTSALRDYISGVQLNIADTVRFRFNLKSQVTVGFEVADDGGAWATREAIVGDGYVELSLRAYELNKDIRITIDGKSCTYNLYTYYNALQTLMNNAGDTGVKFEYNAALRFIQQLYTYAAITDEQLYRYHSVENN